MDAEEDSKSVYELGNAIQPHTYLDPSKTFSNFD